jgi:hypothetical protein
MRYAIRTPVPGYTGMSVGVNFTDGNAEIDGDAQPSQLAYFRAQGYGVEELGDDEDQTPTRGRRAASTEEKSK